MASIIRHIKKINDQIVQDIKMNLDITEAVVNKFKCANWNTLKFSDLVENINEKIVPKESGLEYYIGLEHLDSGSLHIRRFGKTESLKGDKLKIYKGDFIFAKRNAYLKRVAIADFDAVASAHSLVLRAKPGNVLPEFLPFFLLSEKFWERAIEISVGSLSPTINWNVIAEQEFLLPPMEQQAEIAELFWSVDKVIQEDLKVLKTLENLLYVKTNTFFRDSQNKIKIKNIVTHESKIKAEAGLKPYIEIGDINTFNKQIVLKNKESVKGSIIAKKGSILVSKVRPNRGAVHLLKEDQIVTNGFSILIADAAKSSSSFLFYCIAWNNDFYYQLSRLSTGTTYPTVEDENILRYLIPCVDENLQKEYVNEMDKIYMALSNIESKNNKTKNLLNSIINQIF
tara:strand:+ start:1675 stop:2868 length:1194 start_codon:yes stop_codon:yes gene_type:complete